MFSSEMFNFYHINPGFRNTSGNSLAFSRNRFTAEMHSCLVVSPNSLQSPRTKELSMAATLRVIGSAHVCRFLPNRGDVEMCGVTIAFR